MDSKAEHVERIAACNALEQWIVSQELPFGRDETVLAMALARAIARNHKNLSHAMACIDTVIVPMTAQLLIDWPKFHAKTP